LPLNKKEHKIPEN